MNNAEFFEALKLLEKEKGIPGEYLLEKMCIRDSLKPQRMPASRRIASSAGIPSTSRAMPWVLPLQPPSNDTLRTTPSVRSKAMRREQTPLGLY